MRIEIAKRVYPDKIREVLAKRFRAQNDPSLISVGVLFAIFITMSTSCLFSAKAARPVPAVCTFPSSVQKCLPRISLVSYFLLIFHGTDLLLINAFPFFFLLWHIPLSQNVPCSPWILL